MSAGACSVAFERLAGQLGGFGCAGAAPVVQLHNPFALSSWTQPVLELVILTGAVLSLVHAVRRARGGDQAGLALWLGTLVYLVIVEPPLYFPHVFGIEGEVGLIFVHNEFTVQFLFDRLPLYIVLLYPSIPYLAYEIVRRIGVFERRGALWSALTVGLVHECLYEVFDHLGPQLRWWIWNPDAPSNTPWLASVPVSSMALFGLFGVVGMTFAARVLVARKAAEAGPLSGLALVPRVVVVGLAPLAGMVVASLPGRVFGSGPTADHTAQAVVYALEILAVVLVGGWAIIDARRAAGPAAPGDGDDRYVLGHGLVYLGGLGVLWLAALPAYAGATGGLTADGTPVGSLPYALVCYVLSGVFLWLAVARAPQGAPARGHGAAGAAPA